MYTYRKKIEKSHSATLGVSTIDNLNLLSLVTSNTLADIEVKVTLYDVTNSKSSIVYYRTVKFVNPPNNYFAPLIADDSSFSYAEEEPISAAYVSNVGYDVGAASIYIEAVNITPYGTLNCICIIDYKINFLSK